MTVPYYTLELKEVIPKLPAEAQKWVASLKPDELTALKIILNNVGDENRFIVNWRVYKEDADYYRNF